MATNYLTLCSPKDRKEGNKRNYKKRTRFTYTLNNIYEWNRCKSYGIHEVYYNILHLGIFYKNESLFKCWFNDPDSFIISRGILGDENYQFINKK